MFASLFTLTTTTLTTILELYRRSVQDTNLEGFKASMSDDEGAGFSIPGVALDFVAMVLGVAAWGVRSSLVLSD